MSMLADNMIRVIRSSIGENGRLVRDRPFHAFVSHHALKDARGRLRRFSSRSKAFRAAQAFITDHNQVTTSAALRSSSGDPMIDSCGTHEAQPRWTRQGRILNYDGVEAIHVERILDEHSNAKLSPVTCDAIADHVCSALNAVDLDELTRLWKSKT